MNNSFNRHQSGWLSSFGETKCTPSSRCDSVERCRVDGDKKRDLSEDGVSIRRARKDYIYPPIICLSASIKKKNPHGGLSKGRSKRYPIWWFLSSHCQSLPYESCHVLILMPPHDNRRGEYWTSARHNRRMMHRIRSKTEHPGPFVKCLAIGLVAHRDFWQLIHLGLSHHKYQGSVPACFDRGLANKSN